MHKINLKMNLKRKFNAIYNAPISVAERTGSVTSEKNEERK